MEKKCPFFLRAWLGNRTQFSHLHGYKFPPSCKGTRKSPPKIQLFYQFSRKEKLVLEDNCDSPFFFNFLIAKFYHVSSQLTYKSSTWANFVCNLHTRQQRTK